MQFENELTKQDDLLRNLNEIICSFSKKTDFHELESDFYSLISSVIPAHATALYFFKPSIKNPVYISGKGVDNDFLSYYEKQGREVDPLRYWIMDKRSPYQSQLLLGLKGWRHHPVYNVVKTADIDFAMQAPVLSGEQIIGTINFGRELAEGPFRQQDIHTVSILSHFLGLALINSFGIKSRYEYDQKSFHSIENMKQGMVITDSDFKVNYSNHAAKGVIIRHFGNEEPEKGLSSFLKEISRAESDTEIENKNQLSVRTCPLPGSRKKHTIVFLNDNPSPRVNDGIKNILTKRELDVLLLVDRGLQNKQIAGELNVSVNTVKRHLDNMFAKLNVNSRTKLVSKFYYLNNR